MADHFNLMDLATRAIRGFLYWKYRREYERELARERRQMMHEPQEAL